MTTRGISRIAHDEGSPLLKIVTGVRDSEDPQWSTSRDPRHWNYWRREALVYESELPKLWDGTRVGSPRLLGLMSRADGDIALWLEDVHGAGGQSWYLAQHERLARFLGRAQGRIAVAARKPEHPWLTRTFLRDYVA